MTQIRLAYEHATIECRALGNLAARPGDAAAWSVTPASPEAGRAMDELMDGVPAESEGFVGQYRAFHEAVTTGAPFPVTLEDARASLELATAIYHAAATGTVVELPLPTDHPAYGGWIDATVAVPA
jgi:predicted dehydrogenase